MIEVKQLSKVYGKKESAFTALDGIDLAVPDGTSVAIVGKSGSGKSTLMHLMSGLDHPSRGTVVVDDNDISKLKRKQMDRFRAQEIGFIFQAFFVEPNQSCYDNVSLPLEINKVPLSKRKKLIKEALDKVDLGDKLNVPARNLSGGQKQRLSIARAIVNNPTYIFADEPTGNLDSTTGDKVIDLLFSLVKASGGTLCIVTHDTELAERCAMQVTISDGKIVDQRIKPKPKSRKIKLA